MVTPAAHTALPLTIKDGVSRTYLRSSDDSFQVASVTAPGHWELATLIVHRVNTYDALVAERAALVEALQGAVRHLVAEFGTSYPPLIVFRAALALANGGKS